ncbi:filamentous hemagglutinin family outer membrane protein [Escherichia coli]|nr:filamentous hemagglutinin family outer membrane protein [Escherichia coli]
MHSNYDSVQEQTGIFAGRGGFDVTTGQHTQLNGAVIASTATADKNRLDTGTLGFSDTENRADFKTEHQSAGLSTGGSVAGNFLGNMANNLLVGANHEGHADSTTQSAVSAGNITIRDTQSQKQDVADLNRDAAHANQTLSPIFDREKEQQRLQQAQLIGEIGNQVADIARTEGQIAGEKAKRDPAALNQARAELEAAGKPFTEQDVAQRAYNNGMAASGFGTGGKYQQAIQAATAAVQGLAGGNLSAALAGGAAPYLAEVVKTMTTDPVTGEVNKAANVAAHAVVNAALAVAQGNNALAGAAGAAAGEVVGMIATQMYGKSVSELSETEKQTVSTLATVAAGLAGGLVGDSGASAVAGAQSGKTTVENNLLGGSELLQTEKAREHGADVLSCSDNPSGEACKRGQAENKAYAAALATGSVALLPGSAQAMWLLGAGTNAGMQYADSGEINPVNSVAAGWINVITMGQGWKGTIAWNAAGGALTNAINGDDPLTGAITNGAGAGFGYGVGNYVVKPAANTIGKWITGGWNPKFDPTLLKYTEVKGQLGLSKEMVPSKIPSAVGNAGGSLSSEFGSSIIQKKKDAMEAGK